MNIDKITAYLASLKGKEGTEEAVAKFENTKIGGDNNRCTNSKQSMGCSKNGKNNVCTNSTDSGIPCHPNKKCYNTGIIS